MVKRLHMNGFLYDFVLSYVDEVDILAWFFFGSLLSEERYNEHQISEI